MQVDNLLSDPKQRLAWLDALRGIAACCVAFGFHSKFLFTPEARGAEAAGPILAWIRTNGWSMVDLFFVLSGYIFAHVYLARSTLSQPGALACFFKDRFARLYPLHLLTLLMSAVLLLGRSENTFERFLSHLFMLQAVVLPSSAAFDGPSWSISVELICYIAFALAARQGMIAAHRAAWIGMLLGAAILMAQPAEYKFETTVILARGFLGFFLGQLLWHGRAQLARIPTAALLCCLVAGLILRSAFGAPTMFITLTSWPALLLLSLRMKTNPPAPLIWLGDRSYTIYLLHMPIIDLVALRFGLIKVQDPPVLLTTAILIVVILLLADAVYRYFERPARQALRAATWRQTTGKPLVN